MRLNGHELKATTVRDLIRIQAHLGDKAAIIIDDDRLTFAQSEERANRFANGLLARGVRKGDIVATYLYNSIDHVCIWFACAKIGAVWAPLNIALVNVDLRHTLREIEPSILIVDKDLLPNYEEIRPELGLTHMREFLRDIDQGEIPDGWEALCALRSDDCSEPDVQLSWRDPAAIIFTGGSTGLPKGIMVSNAWYFPGIFRYKEMLLPSPEDVHIGLGQMYHTIGSAVDILSPFYFGMTTVLTRWFSASKFFETARKHGCTRSVIIGPTLLALLAQPEKENDSDNPITYAATGTGGISREKVEGFQGRFGIELFELYGQTETGPLGCIGERIDDKPYYSLGKPRGWVEIDVVNSFGESCAPGVTGQILIRPCIPGSFMIGYHNRPDKFAETCSDLWFHSGDLGHLDENGYLHFDGRMAHVIRRRGESISAVEIESIVLDHPSVRRCAAVGIASDMGDEEVKLCLELKAGAKLDPLEIVKFCEDRIAYFKVPRFVEFVDEIPTSASKNEVERHKLQENGSSCAWDREAAGYSVKRRV